MNEFRKILSAISKAHYSARSNLYDAGVSPYESKRSRFLRRAARLDDERLCNFRALTEGLNLETINAISIRTLVRVAEGVNPELAKARKPRTPWQWVKGSPAEKEAKKALCH